jgi:uncharacterized membrane protein (DUF4010 family)
MLSDVNLLGLLIATLGGAAVGLERQWSGHADGRSARFAGIRTFTMLGGVAGLCGLLWTAGFTVPAGILLAGAVALIAAAYIAGSRQDIDGTTEVAALAVVAAGVVAGVGAVRLASGIVALVSLLLIEKSRLHALVRRIDDVGLRAGVRFAAMALIILPILPAGPYGPFGGVRPRELWALVLFFSGISFLGFVARRIVGPGQGYLVTGFFGGLISSTNVTLTFSRLSQSHQTASRELALGAIAANAVLYPRVVAVTAILNASVVLDLARYLVAPAAIAAGVACLGLRGHSRRGDGRQPEGNPLKLAAAIQMAALFQLVLFGVYLARQSFGQSGVLTSAAVLGLTDVDALTMSMAREVGAAQPALAAMAIAVGVFANTLLKLALALFFGTGRFRVLCGGTLALMAAVTAGALLFW